MPQKAFKLLCKGKLRNISPKSISTTLYPYENRRVIEEDEGSQKFDDHVAAFKPQLVPLNTTRTSVDPFVTVK